MDHIYVINYYRVNFAFISKKDTSNLIKNAVKWVKKEHYKCSTQNALYLKQK